MSETGRNEELQNERDVERNNTETPNDIAPTSEVPMMHFVRYDPYSHTRRESDFWKLLLAGSGFTVGGIAAGMYAVRNNFEYPIGMGIISSSSTLVGCYLIAKSLKRVHFRNIFNNLFSNPFNPLTADSQDLEAQRYQELHDRYITPRVQLPSSMATSETSSFPPSPAVSNVSSDVLTVGRADYRPQSTDLSFRQEQEDKAKRYQKFVSKEWTSAPSIMTQRQRSDASGKDEDEKEDEKQVEANADESGEVGDDKEKKV